jgi:hypothetical protein
MLRYQSKLNFVVALSLKMSEGMMNAIVIEAVGSPDAVKFK